MKYMAQVVPSQLIDPSKIVSANKEEGNKEETSSLFLEISLSPREPYFKLMWSLNFLCEIHDVSFQEQFKAVVQFSEKGTNGGNAVTGDPSHHAFQTVELSNSA